MFNIMWVSAFGIYKELILSILIISSCVLASILVKKSRYRKQLIIIMTLAYITGVMYFTMIRGRDIGYRDIRLKISYTIYNAIKQRRYGSTTNRSVLNIIMFIPFGFLLPQLNSSLVQGKGWRKMAILSLLFSLCIESSQYIFRYGVFEIDDLIKNTIGGILGYIMWVVFIENP